MDQKTPYRKPELNWLKARMHDATLEYFRSNIIEQKRQHLVPYALTPEDGEAAWPEFQHLMRLFGSKEDFLVHYYLPVMHHINSFYNLMPEPR